MSEKKYVVPDGMLNAYMEALCLRWKYKKEDWPSVISSNRANGLAGLEAALEWLAKNPIVPTHEQVQRLDDSNMYYTSTIQKCIAEWQRLMFLASEVTIPEEIRDMLADTEQFKGVPLQVNRQGYNAALAEAFRRGRESTKETP